MRILWIIWETVLRALAISCYLSGMATTQSSLTAHSMRGIHGMTGTTQTCDWTGVNRWENYILFNLSSFSLMYSWDFFIAQITFLCPNNTKVYCPKKPSPWIWDLMFHVWHVECDFWKWTSSVNFHDWAVSGQRKLTINQHLKLGSQNTVQGSRMPLSSPMLGSAHSGLPAVVGRAVCDLYLSFCLSFTGT